VGDRTRNVLIAIIVLFTLMGAGTILILPYLNPESGVGRPGAVENVP